MAIPKFLQSCLWSYDLKSLDIKKDKRLIITQVLNFGIEEDLEWLSKIYTKKEIKETLINPSKGAWLKKVINYWLRIFNLKLAKQIWQKAILDINPHFK